MRSNTLTRVSNNPGAVQLCLPESLLGRVQSPALTGALLLVFIV